MSRNRTANEQSEDAPDPSTPAAPDATTGTVQSYIPITWWVRILCFAVSLVALLGGVSAITLTPEQPPNTSVDVDSPNTAKTSRGLTRRTTRRTAGSPAKRTTTVERAASTRDVTARVSVVNDEGFSGKQLTVGDVTVENHEWERSETLPLALFVLSGLLAMVATIGERFTKIGIRGIGSAELYTGSQQAMQHSLAVAELTGANAMRSELAASPGAVPATVQEQMIDELRNRVAAYVEGDPLKAVETSVTHVKTTGGPVVPTIQFEPAPELLELAEQFGKEQAAQAIEERG